MVGMIFFCNADITLRRHMLLPQRECLPRLLAHVLWISTVECGVLEALVRSSRSILTIISFCFSFKYLQYGTECKSCYTNLTPINGVVQCAKWFHCESAQQKNVNLSNESDHLTNRSASRGGDECGSDKITHWTSPYFFFKYSPLILALHAITMAVSFEPVLCATGGDRWGRERTENKLGELQKSLLPKRIISIVTRI